MKGNNHFFASKAIVLLTERNLSKLAVGTILLKYPLIGNPVIEVPMNFLEHEGQRYFVEALSLHRDLIDLKILGLDTEDFQPQKAITIEEIHRTQKVKELVKEETWWICRNDNR